MHRILIMLRVSKLADYATLVLAYMAQRPDALFSAPELAAELKLGIPTVAKILKLLASNGLLTAFRGIHGGYALSHAPKHISIAQVIDAMEAQPFGLTECSAVEGLCAQEERCLIRSNWRRINRMIRVALEEVTIADMILPASATQPSVMPILLHRKESA